MTKQQITENFSYTAEQNLAFHYALKGNQIDIVESNYTELISFLRGCWDNYNAEYAGIVAEMYDHYADPHEKRVPRINSFMELTGLMDRASIFERLWLSIVQVNLKRFEIARPMKVPRAVCDLGVAASLQGFVLTAHAKKAMAQHNFTHLNGCATFVPSPSPEAMQNVFDAHHTPSVGYTFTFFSDDSILTVNVGGVIARFNIDISSCDTSHTRGLFKLVLGFFPPSMQADAKVLIDQLTLPVVIKHPDDPTVKIKLKCSDPKLFSGSTLTTLVNNIACLLIFWRIVSTGAVTSAQIIRAAAEVGYLVTVDVCEVFEDLQFLKCSPARDIYGAYRPLLNLGVFLRASGRCFRDLPGHRWQSLKTRAASFQASLINGMYPRSHFEFIDNMRANFPLSLVSSRSEAVVARILDYKTLNASVTVYFDPSSVFLRYRLTDTERFELEDAASFIGFEQEYQSTGTAKILNKDYGLTWRGG